MAAQAMMTVEAAEAVAAQAGLPRGAVARTVALLDEGNTIPFIARYRKEVTRPVVAEVPRVLFDHLTGCACLRSTIWIKLSSQCRRVLRDSVRDGHVL